MTNRKTKFIVAGCFALLLGLSASQTARASPVFSLPVDSLRRRLGVGIL